MPRVLLFIIIDQVLDQLPINHQTVAREKSFYLHSNVFNSRPFPSRTLSETPVAILCFGRIFSYLR